LYVGKRFCELQYVICERDTVEKQCWIFSHAT
jgi:hypothetical protein